MRTNVLPVAVIAAVFGCGSIDEIQEGMERAEEIRVEASTETDDVTGILCALDDACTRGEFDLSQTVHIAVSADYDGVDPYVIRSGILAWRRVLPRLDLDICKNLDAPQVLEVHRSHLFTQRGVETKAVFYWANPAGAVVHVNPAASYPSTDLREVIAHALGHAFGLGHAGDDDPSIMRWPITYDLPSEADARAVCALHPELDCPVTPEAE